MATPAKGEGVPPAEAGQANPEVSHAPVAAELTRLLGFGRGSP
jgi:hypothetical protein